MTAKKTKKPAVDTMGIAPVDPPVASLLKRPDDPPLPPFARTCHVCGNVTTEPRCPIDGNEVPR